MSDPAKRKRPWWVKLILTVLIVVGSFSVVLGGAVMYFRLSVDAYYKASSNAFIIPDCNKGFVAQGLEYDSQSGGFLISGYMNDNSASPVYLVSRETRNVVKKVFLKDDKGEVYNGHSDGVTVYGDYIYLASGSVYVYSYKDFKNAGSGDYLDCKGVFAPAADEENGVRASFITVDGSKLIIGEFYREQNYKTPLSHKFTTTAGDYCQAIAVRYAFDPTAPLGVKEVPDAVFSLPDLAQGMAFSDGKAYVSCSYGVAFSDIKEYSVEKANTGKTFDFMGHTLPLYELDSASLIKNYKIAPMSEEIIMLNGKLYVMCESASDKYIFGKLTGGEWCYATDLTKM